MKKKVAVVLCGGKGTRLRPYTVVLPKPLMPIGDYPILEVIVRQLVRSNFSKIIMAVNHQADLVKAFFGNGEKWGIKVEYSLEKTPLGTMGPLKLIEGLPDNFLVMNGDILSNINYEKFYDEHCKSNELLTVSSYRRSQKIDYGVLEVDTKYIIKGFQEKPVEEYLVSMGIYMLNSKILDYIPFGKMYGFDDLIYMLLSSNNNVKIKLFYGYWLDIGRPDDYEKAIEEFSTMKDSFID